MCVCVRVRALLCMCSCVYTVTQRCMEINSWHNLPHPHSKQEITCKDLLLAGQLLNKQASNQRLPNE